MVLIKFTDIVKISEKIKKYVEKNHELPSTITVDKETYNYPTAVYLITKAIVNPNKDVELIKMDTAPNPSGESVDFQLTTNEYKSLAKNLITFMTPNKRLPNFLTYKNKKIKQRVFVYSFAKIIVFYNENKRLPNNCGFKTSETISKKTTSTIKKSKYGHATKQGCDNMGQNTSYYCACHSFQEIVRNLYNIVIPQKTLASVMGTTTSGTDHQGIKTAVAWFNKKYNKKLTIEEKYFSDVGANGLAKIISSENQDFIVHLAYKGIYGHYEVVNNINGNTWNVQNSLGSKCSGGCYCGYKEYRSYSTEKSWINAKTGVKSILLFTRN